MRNSQTDEKFEHKLIEVSEILKSHENWSIFIHKKADGDALGSSTALFEAGINLGKHVTLYGPDEKLPVTYKFLSHFEEFTPCENFEFVNSGELYIFLDCSNEARSVKGFDVDKNFNALNIDHHEDNSLFCRVNCVDGGASSTAEVLFRMLKAGRFNITRKIAESLYTGIFTDSGGFTFSNTSPLTHRIVAELIELGVNPARITDFINQNKSLKSFIIWSRAMSRAKLFGPEDIFAISWLCAKDFEESDADYTENEGLPNMLMSLRGVKFAALLTENLNGEVRASFRSREGSPFGAGETARSIGGGGHERAAGATIAGPLECSVESVKKLLLQKYHECHCSD